MVEEEEQTKPSAGLAKFSTWYSKRSTVRLLNGSNRLFLSSRDLFFRIMHLLLAQFKASKDP